MKMIMMMIAAALLTCCARARTGKTQHQQLIESAVESYAQACSGKTSTASCVELHKSLEESLNSFFTDYVKQDSDHHVAEQSWLMEMRRRLNAVR